MALDLTQFHGTFFDESFEAIDGMEAALLALDVGAPDAERINTIFRCAHSIKGGSAMFAFDEVTSFAHSLETLLDELRGKGMQVTTAIADLLLKSVDVMRELLRGLQNKQPHDAERVADLQRAIERAIAGSPEVVAVAPGAAQAAAAMSPVASATAAKPATAPLAAAKPSVTAPPAATAALAMAKSVAATPVADAAPSPISSPAMDAPVDQAVTLASTPKQVLTFILGEETYGVDILSVQEIRGWTPVTSIPYAPAHVLGVLNLRGAIIPVVDLRIRFALEKAEYVAVTVIVVLSVISRGTRRNFGVVVDGVSDVVDVDAAQVRPTPDLGSPAATEHVLGLLPTADRMVILLDLGKLIGHDLADGRANGAESPPAAAA